MSGLAPPSQLKGPIEWRLDLVALGVLIALSVAFPLAISAIAGAADIPRNDDWSYRAIALEMYSTGEFSLDGAAQTASVGQVVLTQPILWLTGGSPFAFVIAGAVFAACATVAGYLLARLYVRPVAATAAVLGLILYPGYLAYSTSFMTDVPAIAGQAACLALGTVALRRPVIRMRWLAAAVAIGLAAFTIREFALAAPAAILACAVWRQPRRPAVWVAAALAVVFLACWFLWRATLARQVGVVPVQDGLIGRLLMGACTVGLAMLPFVLATWRVDRARRGRMLLAGGLSVVVLAPLIAAVQNGIITSLIIDNLFSPSGVPPGQYILGARPELLPPGVWILINVTSAIGLAMLLATAGARTAAVIRPRLGTPLTSADPLVAFVVAAFAGLVAFGTRFQVFDRYLWPVFIPIAVLLVMHVPATATAAPLRTRRNAAGAVVLGALGAIAIVFAVNGVAFDGARWRVAQGLVDEGMTASTIDGGYEWMGTFATVPFDPFRPVAGRTWWQDRWPDYPICAAVASSETSAVGLEAAKRIDAAYRLLLLAGPPQPLFVYVSRDPSCAT